MHYNRQPLIPDTLDPWESLFINIDNQDIANYRPQAMLKAPAFLMSIP